MNQYNQKIAFIIPTEDRPEDLGRKLAGLARQTQKSGYVNAGMHLGWRADDGNQPLRSLAYEFW